MFAIYLLEFFQYFKNYIWFKFVVDINSKIFFTPIVMIIIKKRAFEKVIYLFDRVFKNTLQNS